MAQPSITWRMDERVAKLRCGPLEANVEFSRDSPTFFPVTWDGRSVEKFAAFTALALDESNRAKGLVVQDKYVRGHDLVATYARIAPHLVSPQTYWRAQLLDDHHAVAIEFLMSAQTELLDSDPRFSVSSFGMETRLFHTESLSRSEFAELRRPDDNQPTDLTDFRFDRSESALRLFVFRHEQLGLSYAEAVHPSDYSSVDVHSTPQSPWFINWTLFPERLEKGVIRRARICGWFMPAENDLDTAVELAKRFVDEPPPLTT
jgi:hypothetical protein